MNGKYQIAVLSGLILGVILFSLVLNLKQKPQNTPQVLAVYDVAPSSTPTPTEIPKPALPELEADSFIIKKMESDILASKQMNYRLFPASTTKMMTALVAVKKYPISKLVTVKKPYEVGAVIGLQSGEVLSLENLLYGLLLNSGNDAAMAIAEGLENSDDFISEMNKEVAALGLKDTQFVNPSGLDHPDHYSSAYDLALIGEALLSNPELAKIVGTKNTVVYNYDRKIAHVLENRNKLLGNPGIIGVKTGFTDTAGEVLVTAVQRDGATYLIVVMGSQDRFADTEILVRWLDRYLYGNETIVLKSVDQGASNSN